MSPEDAALSATERVALLLDRLGIGCAIIGAVALAAHRYPRSTEDIDLAIGVHPDRLEEIASELRREGFLVDVSLPDPADPLGGVIRAQKQGIDRIEIVNFQNPPGGGFPALIERALQEAKPLREGAPLRVVTLPHLILFKLYAGGMKSKNDVFELLSRNPAVDLQALQEECRRFRMDRRLSLWLRELARSGEE